MELIDKPKHQGKRNRLIRELSQLGIESTAVLEAFYKVPRHFFLDSSFEDFAYQNKAFPIEVEQTISHPYTVAFQTEVLQIKPGDKILEIGTGSGFQTSILYHLGAQVFSIERQHVLYDKARQLLSKLRVKAKLIYGDGYEGIPKEAPFDKMIITAGAPTIPKKLFKQLKVGGLMIIPIGSPEQIMSLIIKTSNTEYETIEYGNFDKEFFKFVPMLKNKQ